MFKLFSPKRKDIQYGWFGNYASWHEAAASAGGYDSGNILQKTKDALLQVKNGTAVYERDSVVFEHIEYPFPLISCLLRSAALLKRPLNILDFGGSLGSTYYQVKDFVGTDCCASWNIVEQEHYVNCGKANFEDDHLKFYHSIDHCLLDTKIDLILLSGSVQYMPAPHDLLKKVAAYNFGFIVFDRTAFHDGLYDRLTLQTVPPEIYEASYPSWFFNKEGFLNHFKSNYNIICELPPFVEGESVISIDHQPLGYNKGFYLLNQSFNA
ncbi:putative methyltransferase, LIC12133 family [Pedobacter westerhofensis]|uniref:Putative methyltransferase, LIC12133 family n=1 Tax=Pedobacter westerhofensis TaxID=425512 RepID=A0A521FP60_9SPHI|nr:TIGR04325 family methyltransferase [Pedobacter westerhofensis]SMO97938.1 putative methyltransferase, LIC12133 family [Pedobacter westerhofensis]